MENLIHNRKQGIANVSIPGPMPEEDDNGAEDGDNLEGELLRTSSSLLKRGSERFKNTDLFFEQADFPPLFDMSSVPFELLSKLRRRINHTSSCQPLCQAKLSNYLSSHSS